MEMHYQTVRITNILDYQTNLTKGQTLWSSYSQTMEMHYQTVLITNTLDCQINLTKGQTLWSSYSQTMEIHYQAVLITDVFKLLSALSINASLLIVEAVMLLNEARYYGVACSSSNFIYTYFVVCRIIKLIAQYCSVY